MRPLRRLAALALAAVAAPAAAEPAHRAEVAALAFSPDGATLYSAALDGSVRALDGRTGKVMRRARPATAAVHALAVSPDGRALALAGADGRVRLLDAATLAETAAPARQGRLGGKAPDAARVQGWIADLDSDDFARREAALEELRRVAHRVEAELRVAARTAPLEQRLRLDALLVPLDGPVAASELLREIRAVAALERQGGDAAKVLLKSLAGGGGRTGAEAKAALARLATR